MLSSERSALHIDAHAPEGARGAFLGAGAHIVPVPVDEEGLMVKIGMERAPEARLVYLTPSHQFPLGMTMSLARRLALLDWAKQNYRWVIEVVKRCADAHGFQALPHRWIVERTFAWLGHYRRLSKDYEVLPESSEAMIQIAMIRLMLARLARKHQTQQQRQQQQSYQAGKTGYALAA